MGSGFKIDVFCKEECVTGRVGPNGILQLNSTQLDTKLIIDIFNSIQPMLAKFSSQLKSNKQF